MTSRRRSLERRRTESPGRRGDVGRSSLAGSGTSRTSRRGFRAKRRDRSGAPLSSACFPQSSPGDRPYSAGSVRGSGAYPSAHSRRSVLLALAPTVDRAPIDRAVTEVRRRHATLRDADAAREKLEREAATRSRDHRLSPIPVPVGSPRLPTHDEMSCEPNSN